MSFVTILFIYTINYGLALCLIFVGVLLDGARGLTSVSYVQISAPMHTEVFDLVVCLCRNSLRTTHFIVLSTLLPFKNDLDLCFGCLRTLLHKLDKHTNVDLVKYSSKTRQRMYIDIMMSAATEMLLHLR